MRRVGYIIEEIVEPSNMEASFRQVLRAASVNAAARGAICSRISRGVGGAGRADRIRYFPREGLP